MYTVTDSWCPGNLTLDHALSTSINTVRQNILESLSGALSGMALLGEWSFYSARAPPKKPGTDCISSPGVLTTELTCDSSPHPSSQGRPAAAAGVRLLFIARPSRAVSIPHSLLAPSSLFSVALSHHSAKCARCTIIPTLKLHPPHYSTSHVYFALIISPPPTTRSTLLPCALCLSNTDHFDFPPSQPSHSGSTVATLRITTHPRLQSYVCYIYIFFLVFRSNFARSQR